MCVLLTGGLTYSLKIAPLNSQRERPHAATRLGARAASEVMAILGAAPPPSSIAQIAPGLTWGTEPATSGLRMAICGAGAAFGAECVRSGPGGASRRFLRRLPEVLTKRRSRRHTEGADRDQKHTFRGMSRVAMTVPADSGSGRYALPRSPSSTGLRRSRCHRGALVNRLAAGIRSHQPAAVSERGEASSTGLRRLALCRAGEP